MRQDSTLEIFHKNIKNFGVGIEPTKTSQETGGAPFAFPPLHKPYIQLPG